MGTGENLGRLVLPLNFVRNKPIISGGAPEWVGQAHSADQITDLGITAEQQSVTGVQ